MKNLRPLAAVLWACVSLTAVQAAAGQVSEQKLSPSTPGLYYGEGMAVSQGYLFVGSEQGYSPESTNGSNGYVDVYSRQAAGWEYDSTVTAFGLGPLLPNGSDHFGNAVAVDGNWMAVAGHVANSNIESIYVFQRINGTWVASQRLDRPDHGTGPSVNETVVMRSGHLLVAAEDFDDIGDVQGFRVLAYELQGGSFILLGELGRPLQQALDGFGSSLAFVGDRLAVGAPGYVDESGKRGMVFTYVFNDAQWVHLSLLQPDGVSPLSFGQSLAECFGGQLVVGVPNTDNSTSGSSLVGYLATYMPSEVGWSEGPTVQSTDALPPKSFGSSIGCDGGVLGVATRGANVAYRFIFAQGAWQQSDAFATSDPATAGFAGPIVVSARDVLVADMFQGSTTPVGAVYAFDDDALFANGFE